MNAVKDTLSFLVFIIALLMILPEFGVNIGPILAGLGLAGLALGMGARDLITDFLAGFFLVVEGEINIGDKAKIGDAKGTIAAISLRRTIIQGKDGSIYLIPNREIKMIRRYAGKKSEKKI
jgi:small conductance mechanosensitive channel